MVAPNKYRLITRGCAIKKAAYNVPDSKARKAGKTYFS